MPCEKKLSLPQDLTLSLAIEAEKMGLRRPEEKGTVGFAETVRRLLQRPVPAPAPQLQGKRARFWLRESPEVAVQREALILAFDVVNVVVRYDSGKVDKIPREDVFVIAIEHAQTGAEYR